MINRMYVWHLCYISKATYMCKMGEYSSAIFSKTHPRLGPSKKLHVRVINVSN